MIVCECILLPHTLIQTCALLEQPLKEFLSDALRLRQMTAIVAARFGR
jgi:hypothetical protein